MPNVSRHRTLPATPEAIWEVIGDPHHLPRWWPSVKRVEGVTDDHFTEVIFTKKGRPIRVDFTLLASEPPYRRAWQQDIAGTPFERVLAESIIEVSITRDGERSEVSIGHHQQLRGYSRTGGLMLRRATRGKLDEALDGLEQIFG